MAAELCSGISHLCAFSQPLKVPWSRADGLALRHVLAQIAEQAMFLHTYQVIRPN